MRKISLAFCLVPFFFTNLFSQQSYFPLKVGNYWQYKVKQVFQFDTTFYYDFSRVIKDTTIVETSNHYYLVELALNLGLDSIQYLRYDSLLNSIIEYDSLRGGESVIFKLDATNNECWDYFGYQLCSGSTDTLEIFGDYKIVKDYYKSSSTPPWWGYNLAEDFGPTNIFDNQGWGYVLYSDYDLIYCKIDGIEYGQFVSVDDKDLEIPSKFYLSQNYPNPFNPNTKIIYQLPNAGNVTLKVFDVLGREVATSVDEYKNAGNYDVEFNAINLSSGIYFYQLKAGDYLETKKMIFLK